MKKYAEILEAITATRAGMVDTAKSEKEFTRKAMVIAHKSGTDAEFDAAQAAYKAAEEKFAAECEHNEDARMAVEILKDNAAQAFFAESIEIICTIWNKYAGKPHGEKTSDNKHVKKERIDLHGTRIYCGTVLFCAASDR